MTITLDRQVELQGLLMGPGTPYSIEAFNPWTFPELAANDLARPQRHGVLAGRDLLRGRRITLTINVLGAGKQAALDNMHTLLGAWQPLETDVELTWRAGTRTYRALGRPRLADPDPRLIAGGVIQVQCRFLATGPFIEDTVEQNDDTTFPESTDLYYDPYTETYVDPLTNGRVSFVNAGNTYAPWIAEFIGPWVDPIIYLLDPDDPAPVPAGTWTLDLTLADGQVLLIDSLRERVYLDGTLRLDLAAIGLDWFAIPPGAWDLRFDGDSGTGTGEAWMRSTWL